MTHEFILTSVAHGLSPTDHGFCPVAADSALSPRVTGYLLDLSDYQRLVDVAKSLIPQKPAAIFSHFILPSEIEHVLTRVTDAGIDYRKQPNILVHHVVLDTLEAPPEGPAWLLALPGFHLTEWNSAPTPFVQGRPIPSLASPPSLTRRQQIARQHRWLDPALMTLTGSVDQESDSYHAAVQSNDQQITLTVPPTSPCPLWERLTGDSGWGGILAETAHSKQPIVLIYSPEQNILPLFVEALALLPPFLSWKVSFCTHFTGTPDAIPCQWKAVLAGSDDAVRLSQDLNNMVLDITKPLGAAPAGKYVEYARYGQEYLVPLTFEEHAASLINADTKPYGEDTAPGVERAAAPLKQTSITISKPQPVIRQQPKRRGFTDFFLRRTSRFQFYVLYSIMFVLILVLLVLAIDQAGKFGLLQRFRTAAPAVDAEQVVQEQEHPSELEIEAAPPEPAVVDPAAADPIVTAEKPDPRKIYEEDRQKQKALLLPFWQDFDPPSFLPLPLPTVKESQIDVPEKITYPEFQAFFPVRASVDLQFVPLFELPKMTVETRLDADSLPEIVWNVDAVDTDTQMRTPMFAFQLLESGLSMEWQKEGLNDQYLYETVLSSLGFLRLSVADAPETGKEIPLFAPVYASPMRVSELAGLAAPSTAAPSISEIAVDLPLASELWTPIFAEKKPPYTLRLEIWAEPAGDWPQIQSAAASECTVEIQTAQQAGKPTETGETVFENIVLPFHITASLEKIIWKGNEFTKRLQEEQASIGLAAEELDKRIEQLKEKIFVGGINEADRNEREKCETERQKYAARLIEIDNLLEKLPSAYDELRQNETKSFHYSVFLESTENNRKLLLLTTD